MPRAPTADDLEQLRHVAADADGAPLTDADLAFLASDQETLRVDDWGGLVVLGIARTTYYRADQVRTAIAEARRLWALIRHAADPIPGRLPDPPPSAEDAALLELQLEAEEDPN